jgi:hypothetical protein
MVEFGPRTRVEASGVLLLRSMCKLTHKGHQQYAKGDGHAFEDYLRRDWPGVKNRLVVALPQTVSVPSPFQSLL